MSTKLEVKDFLKSNDTDILCLVETKLNDAIANPIHDERYNTWRRDRTNKQRGGILIVVKKELEVSKVLIGRGLDDIVNVHLKTKVDGRCEIGVVYVPPKTSSWKTDEYQQMINDIETQLKTIMENNHNLALMGDLNCGKVQWEDWYTEGCEESWGNKLLNLIMENAMTQW